MAADFEKLVKQFEAKMVPVSKEAIETGIIPEQPPPGPPEAPPAEGKPACITKPVRELIDLFFKSIPTCPE